jgi:hypothetical protein
MIWKLRVACILASTGVANAQFGRGGAEWVTNGSDAQRSHSIPADPKISTDGLLKPGFQFLWKTRLNNEAVQLNSLTPAILMDRYIGYRGFRSLAFIAGSSNVVFAIDSDLNRIEWQTRVPVSTSSPGSLTCPGGMTSAIARSTSATYPTPGAVGGGGRGGPARSGVGEPNAGAVTIAPALAAQAGPNRGPGIRLPGLIYALAGDGMLHALYLSNGAESEPPTKFVPSNANTRGFIVIDNVGYVATENCNGAPSGVWAVDLTSKQVASWKPSNGGIAGSAGPAFGPDGTLYVTTTGGDLVGLEAKTLTVKDTYVTGGPEFTSSPVVFPYKDRNLVAAATKDGRINLLDAASVGSTLFKTPPYSATANFSPDALATWQSEDGVRWLLAALSGVPGPSSGFSARNGPIANSAIAAWKLVEGNGAVSLEPGWVSRDLISPLTPMIINGVVFALSSGEYRTDDKSFTAAQRAQRSSPAVLYALDGVTGKVLWDSGKTITSFVHSGGLSGGASQLYLEAYDQTLYAFGFPIEH